MQNNSVIIFNNNKWRYGLAKSFFISINTYIKSDRAKMEKKRTCPEF